MSFLLRWLGLTIEKPAGLTVRPARTVDVVLPYDEAFDRCVRGLEVAAGANVTLADRAGGTIEAAFGLINSERIGCTLKRIDDAHTAVTMESRRFAGTGLSQASPVLDRLEVWLKDGR